MKLEGYCAAASGAGQLIDTNDQFVIGQARRRARQETVATSCAQQQRRNAAHGGQYPG